MKLLSLLAILLVGCASVDSGPKGYIKVDCTGNTFEHAKTNCFNKAVEIVVGTVIVAGTEAQNNNLVKYEVLKHSAGYIDDFRIITQTSNSQKTNLVMVVKVRDSKIAERIMSAQNANGTIQGERLGNQYNSFIKHKDSGDRLLRTVLQDYPKHAFNIQKGEVLYQANINREPVIVVPYRIKWNPKYLQALNEVLAITHDGKSNSVLQDAVHIAYKEPSAWLLGKTNSYYFNDVSRARMIKNTFVGKLYVHIKFKDANGVVIKSGCDDGTYISGPNITEPFSINGNQIIDEEMNIVIRTNKHKMEKINTVDVSFSEQQCKIID